MKYILIPAIGLMASLAVVSQVKPPKESVVKPHTVTKTYDDIACPAGYAGYFVDLARPTNSRSGISMDTADWAAGEVHMICLSNEFVAQLRTDVRKSNVAR